MISSDERQVYPGGREELPAIFGEPSSSRAPSYLHGPRARDVRLPDHSLFGSRRSSIQNQLRHARGRTDGHRGSANEEAVLTSLSKCSSAAGRNHSSTTCDSSAKRLARTRVTANFLLSGRKRKCFRRPRSCLSEPPRWGMFTNSRASWS